MNKKVFLLALIVLIFAVNPVLGSVVKDIKVTLREKQIQDLSQGGVNLVFYVDLRNSSSKPYYLSRYAYRFVVNQKEFLRLETSLEQGVLIEPHGDTLISIPIKITYYHLFRVIPEIQNETQAQCYLMGDLYFTDGRKERGGLPVSFTGEFPVFKKPVIEFVQLEINMISIGGADINFGVRFKNHNGFEFLVDRILYSVNLGSYPIGEGRISGDKNIESLGEKEFMLPLLLNFHDVGMDVYRLLQKSSVSCRFYGEFEIVTAWGRIPIPFDELGEIAIIRDE